jgi:hypothetical protein
MNKLDFAGVAANAAQELFDRRDFALKKGFGFEPADVIFEVADSFVPVYNGDVMDLVHGYPDLWNREPECGFAGTTIVDFARTLIFDALIDHLWTCYNNQVEKENP